MIDLQKISVFYYVLLEFDYATGERRASNELAEKAFLPEKYQIYMKGLWHLDRREFEVHCSCFLNTNPGLTCIECA